MKSGILIFLVIVTLLGLGIWSTLEEQSMEEKRQFSQDQLAILAANGTPQERIEQDVLLPSEERVLEAFGYARAYLEQRYPQEKFSFAQLDHSTTKNASVMLYASCSETPQESFAVCVKGEKPPYEVTESHFSDIKRAEVNDLVKGTFARIGIEAACDLKIPGLYGDAYDPALSIESLIKKGLEIPVTGRVLVMEDVGVDLEAVRSALLAVGLTGGFSIYAIQEKSVEMACADELMADRMGYISLPVQRQEVQ